MEVYNTGYQSFSKLMTFPPSQLRYVHHNLHLRSSTMPSSLGITSNVFTQRITGYFVPPIDSLYTFNVLSVSGECQFYLAFNNSEVVLIAFANRKPFHG